MEEFVKDKLFNDARSIERKNDVLQAHYTTAEVARRVWQENLQPRLNILFFSGLAMIFTAAATACIPYMIERTADDVFVAQKENVILPIAIAVIAITAIKSLSEYIANVSVSFLGYRYISDLRTKLYRKLTYADLSWIETIHSGRFMSSFLNDINLIHFTASRAIVVLIQHSALAIGLAVYMFYLEWRFATLLLIFMPVGVYIMGRQRRRMRKSTTKSMQETGDLSTLISQTLRSIRIVRAYGQEEREIKRATDVVERTLEFNMRGTRARAISSPAVEFLTGIGFAFVIYYAGVKGLRGEATIGGFMGFMAAAMLIYAPLKSIATLQTSLQEGVAAASRVYGIIDQKSELFEKTDAKDIEINAGEIRFDNVDFSYDPNSPVLKKFSLHVPAGKTVALVGPSGAGKSTVLNLALRFYDPQSGKILIDGQNIADTKISSLRRAAALVTQDPVLFDDTVGANITYGTSDEDPDKLRAAAKAAAADGFISQLPHGYDSGVGEAGNTLSGGERQRIAIARAIYRDAPILLLDEPTSSLDSQAEEIVQKALERLMKGRTVLMIAHRLSTVKKADLICVMNEGKLVETGNHDELVAKGGLYSRLHKTQFGQNEISEVPEVQASEIKPTEAIPGE